jgi:hypothetical protein
MLLRIRLKINVESIKICYLRIAGIEYSVKIRTLEWHVFWMNSKKRMKLRAYYTFSEMIKVVKKVSKSRLMKKEISNREECRV